MQTTDPHSKSTQPADMMKFWLAAQLAGDRSSRPSIEDQQFPPLPPQRQSDRLALLRQVLDADRMLAQAVRRLPFYDQMRLTIEVLRANALPATSTLAQIWATQSLGIPGVRPFGSPHVSAARHAHRDPLRSARRLWHCEERRCE